MVLIFLKMMAYCSSTFRNKEKECFAIPLMSPSYRMAFLSNSTSGWPQLTSAWHLTQGMHYISVAGSSYQIRGGYEPFPKQVDLWMTFDLWWGHLENMLLGSGAHPLYLHAKFQPRASKHEETHSWTHTRTPTHTTPHTP